MKEDAEKSYFGADIVLPGHPGDGVKIGEYSATGVPVYGWRDITGLVRTRGIGTDPAWAQMGSGPFYAYKFAVAKEATMIYHIPHDMVPGSQFYIHAHWVSGGTSKTPVRWRFDYTLAKGFNQSAFDMTGTTIYAQENASGIAWQHMVTETVGISSDEFEVDGLIMVKVTREATSPTNPNDIFLLMTDIHYQSTNVATKNKAPNFYE